MPKHCQHELPTRIAALLLLMGVSFSGTLFAQSVADVARRDRARVAREVKTGKVYTNDDIPKTVEVTTTSTVLAPGTAGQEKTEPAKETTEPGKPAAAAKEEPKPGAPEKTQADLEKEYREKFAKLRETQQFEERKLDVMQRELNLLQQQFYGDPNVALREQTFRGDINRRTQEMEQQRTAVEKAKKAVSDLEDELRLKGLPPGIGR